MKDERREQDWKPMSTTTTFDDDSDVAGQRVGMPYSLWFVLYTMAFTGEKFIEARGESGKKDRGFGI